MVKKIEENDEKQPAIERKKQTRKDFQEPEECEIIEKKLENLKLKNNLML